jgi:hypothetical protein
MVEKHGLIITFGQQGNIGSTANWLTLVIASLATISVMNGKVNATVRQWSFCSTGIISAGFSPNTRFQC